MELLASLSKPSCKALRQFTTPGALVQRQRHSNRPGALPLQGSKRKAHDYQQVLQLAPPRDDGLYFRGPWRFLGDIAYQLKGAVEDSLL